MDLLRGVDCLDDVQVADYLERRLAGAAVVQLQAHLDECPGCLALVSQLADPSVRAAPDGLRLGRTIASGGMGLIIEAYDTHLRRTIALKVPRTLDAGVRRRFEREVHVTARLQHPAILPVYAAGTLGAGEPYYAMRLVDGQSLDAVIAAASSLEARLPLLRVVTQVAGAIAYAHAQGVIHRDIKPANVLVGAFGEVVVIDWGLARVVSEPDEDVGAGLALGSPGPQLDGGEALTVDGAIIGTPAYMAPEQARGEPATERADVYALGALLYHVLRGVPPGRGAPADLASTTPGLPRDLVAIVHEAMAVEPTARYASAAGLAADLARFEAGRLVDAHRYTAWQLFRRWAARHRTALAVGGLLATALGVTAFVASRRVEHAERTRTTQHTASGDLVGWMLEDLRQKLGKVGKLELLDGFGEKIDAYYGALGGASAALTSDDLRRWAEATEVLAEVARDSGDLVEAEARSARTLALRGQVVASAPGDADDVAALGLSHKFHAEVQVDLGATRDALASFASAEAAYVAAIAAAPERAIRHLDLAVLLAKRGEFEAGGADRAAAPDTFGRAMAALDAAMARASADATFDEERATVLLAVSRGEAAAGHLDRAVELAAQSLASAERFAQRDPSPRARTAVAASAITVGDLERDRGGLEAALVAYQRFVATFAALTQHDPANVDWQAAHALGLVRVGGLHQRRGDVQAAADAYEQGLVVRQALVDHAPENQAALRELGDSFDRLGFLAADRGALREAIARLRQGLEVTRRLSALDPAQSLYVDDVCNSLGNISELERRQGLATASLVTAREALAAAQLADQQATTLRRRRQLSKTWTHVGESLFADGQHAAGMAAYREAQAIDEAMVAAHPDDGDAHRELAGVLETLVERGTAAKPSVALAERAVAVRRAIVATAPDELLDQHQLSYGLLVLANAAMKAGDGDAAQRASHEASTIAVALSAREPDNLTWAQQVMQAAGVDGDIALERGLRPQALAAFQTAVDIAAGVLATDERVDAKVQAATYRVKLARLSAAPRRTELIAIARRDLEALAQAGVLTAEGRTLLADIRAGR